MIPPGGSRSSSTGSPRTAPARAGNRLQTGRNRRLAASVVAPSDNRSVGLERQAEVVTRVDGTDPNLRTKIAAALAAGKQVVVNKNNGGHWVLTRRDHLAEAFADFARFTSSQGASVDKVHAPGDPKLAPIELDPPAQQSFRRLFAPAFIVSALKESNAYCERAYTQTDAATSGSANLFGQQRTRLYALMMNAMHDNEHYGNVVTYLRMNKMVPPSSKPGR